MSLPDICAALIAFVPALWIGAFVWVFASRNWMASLINCVNAIAKHVQLTVMEVIITFDGIVDGGTAAYVDGGCRLE